MTANGPEGGFDYFASVVASYDRLQPILAGPSYETGMSMLVDLIPLDEKNGF